MLSYVVKSNRNQQIRGMLAFKGEAQTVQYDFSPWEADNGTVTSVNWELKDGQAAISNKSLASSIASALITTSESGISLIKLTATAGNNIFVTHLRVVTKDPHTRIHDYGIHNGYTC